MVRQLKHYQDIGIRGREAGHYIRLLSIALNCRQFEASQKLYPLNQKCSKVFGTNT